MKSFTFTLRTDCNKCGKTVGVNGPLRSLTCDTCFEKMKLTPKFWSDQVAAAEEGMRIWNYQYVCLPAKEKKPHCYNCEKPFSDYKSYIGKDTKIICKHCGKSMYTFPAPKYLTKVLPMVVQIISTERDSEEESTASLDMKADQNSMKPVIFTCPNCSAVLRIGSETARILTCEHCDSDVYMPDPIWNRLHPVKKILPWTIIYNGNKLEAKE